MVTLFYGRNKTMQQTQTINKLDIAEPEQFVRFFKFYQKCNDQKEITLNFDRDRLHFREMNPANTLMTDITIKDSLFTEFYAEKSKKDISMTDFLNFLKRANKEDLLVMEFNDTKYNVILKSSITRTFTGYILNPEKTEQKLPCLNFSARATINSKILFDFLKDYKKEAKNIEISAKNKALTLKVLDFDNKQIGTTTIETDSFQELYQNMDGITEPVKSRFTFELFKNAITNKLTENIVLFLGNTYPIQIEYNEPDKYNAVVIIAPYVEDGEDLKAETEEPIKVEMEDKDYYKEPESSSIINDLPKPKEIGKIEIKHSGKHPEIQWKKQKKGKLDLDALGYNENFKCPNCKGMISFYFFMDKFATQLGVIKEVLEQDYNADPEFAEFVFESDEDFGRDFEKLAKARLKELHKKFKRGG